MQILDPTIPPLVKLQENCRICKSKDLLTYLDLGPMPLANRNLSSSQLDSKEPVFPLQLLFCEACGLSQLSVVVSPQLLYQDYTYYSSVSATFQQHCKDMVLTLKGRLELNLELKPKSFVLEIASNDGCLLSKFAEAGFQTAGVEPAQNLASVAKSKGLPIFCQFWGKNVAGEIHHQFGSADLIICTNVLAHVDDLDDFLNTVISALNPNGYFVFEVPYMADYIEYAVFDTTYHEHLSYFLLSPLKQVLEANGFRIIDAERFKIHGGSIRVICCKSSASWTVSSKVKELLTLEKNLGLLGKNIYFEFAKRVEKIKNDLVYLLSSLKLQKKRICAYGASAKGNVLLNYCGVGKETIDYIIDDTPAKQGKFQSGTHLPIVQQSRMLKERPDYLLILAWNFSEELMNKTAVYHQTGGHYIIPLPEIKVIHSPYPAGRPEHQKNLPAAKVAAVLPAYESAATVAGVLNSLPREFFQYIILVDDHSKDQTFEIASKDKSILVYRNEKNLGYGGNLKKCLRIALELGADIIIEIHPDGEYGLESIGPAINEMKSGAGLVLGNRFALAGGPLKNGMFAWKYPFVKVLNWLGNCVLGTHLGDLHQGFRVYSSTLLKKIDFNNNSDDYIFSFQIIAQAVFHKFPIREVPISCHYKGKKRGARLNAVIAYSISVFIIIIQFLLAKVGMPSRLFKKSCTIRH